MTLRLLRLTAALSDEPKLYYICYVSFLGCREFSGGLGSSWLLEELERKIFLKFFLISVYIFVETCIYVRLKYVYMCIKIFFKK